ELKVEENLRAGMELLEARHAAERQFGNQTLLRELSREMWGVRSIETIFQDLRYGVRMLLKSPGVTLMTVVTLALGIGANTAIFSVVHAVLLRPLPFAEQERLIVAWKKDMVAFNPLVEVAFAEFKDWQAQSQSFGGMAVMPTIVLGAGYVLTGRGEAVQVESSKVSGGFFGLLGGKAGVGRVFGERDDVLDGPEGAGVGGRFGE